MTAIIASADADGDKLVKWFSRGDGSRALVHTGIGLPRYFEVIVSAGYGVPVAVQLVRTTT